MDHYNPPSLTFFGIFLLGLGLNLTPCVYPMLSITVSVFRGHRDKSHLHAFLKSLVYVLGMAVVYSALGVSTAFTGSLFGSVLQSRWVLLAIGFLMAGMSASLFGFYSIQAPQWMVKLASRRGSDFVGVFLSGLFVGVFAAPCIGPLIIALIAFVAQKADPIFAFQTFFVLSLGLGFPYILLGTFSGLVQKLPKSGVWLVWVDRMFGTILLGVAFFYFVLAIHPEWLIYVMPIGLILGGGYLGFVERSPKYTPNFLFFKRLFGVLLIVTGILTPLLTPKHSVVWEAYSPDKLERAAANRQLVVMDFYADWCIPCHELDNQTYRNEKVIEGLKEFVRLKVNLTNPEDPALEKLIEQYNVLGVPTILFLDRQGQELKDLRQAGFVSAEEFLQLLAQIKK